MEEANGIRIYQNELEYIQTSTDRKARMARIRQTIAALETQRLNLALNQQASTVQEYSLDDGQSKIRTVFRGLPEITNLIAALDRELVMLQNRGIGRMHKLMDENNFKYGRR